MTQISNTRVHETAGDVLCKHTHEYPFADKKKKYRTAKGWTHKVTSPYATHPLSSSDFRFHWLYFILLNFLYCFLALSPLYSLCSYISPSSRLTLPTFYVGLLISRTILALPFFLPFSIPSPSFFFLRFVASSLILPPIPYLSLHSCPSLSVVLAPYPVLVRQVARTSAIITLSKIFLYLSKVHVISVRPSHLNFTTPVVADWSAIR